MTNSVLTKIETQESPAADINMDITDANLDAVPTKALAETAGKPNPWHAFIATWLGGVFDGMDSSIFAIVLFPALS